MPITTFEAAKKICHLGAWGVTNLKLQKILYIAHMIFMGKNGGTPLIFDRFQAWDYGPVVPELYQEVRMYGSGPIRTGFYGVPLPDGTPEAREIEAACSFLLHQTAGRLVDFTHRPKGAWDRNYVPGVRGILIPNEHILEEYHGLFA